MACTARPSCGRERHALALLPAFTVERPRPRTSPAARFQLPAVTRRHLEGLGHKSNFPKRLAEIRFFCSKPFRRHFRLGTLVAFHQYAKAGTAGNERTHETRIVGNDPCGERGLVMSEREKSLVCQMRRFYAPHLRLLYSRAEALERDGAGERARSLRQQVEAILERAARG